MQPKQHQSQTGGSEKLYSRPPTEHHQVQSAARGMIAGSLQVVSEARVLEAGQTLPAVGCTDQLFCDVAGEPVASQALKGCSERLDELPQGQSCRSQSNPGQQRKLDRHGIQVGEQT